MKSAKQQLKIAAVIFILSITLSGCITQWLHKDYSEYIENVSSVLISQDKKKIVVIGKEYHYIFDAPTTLVNTLESPIHNKVKASFSDFAVDSSGYIHGGLGLFLNDEATDSEKTIARSIGINNNYRASSLNWSGRLSGTRYSAQKFTGDTSSYKLNHPYSVRIKVERSAIVKAMRVPLTPITISADGVLILTFVALAPLAILIDPRPGKYK